MKNEIAKTLLIQELERVEKYRNDLIQELKTFNPNTQIISQPKLRFTDMVVNVVKESKEKLGTLEIAKRLKPSIKNRTVADIAASASAVLYKQAKAGVVKREKGSRNLWNYFI